MIKTVTTMKSGYNNTIRKGEGELKPLTNTAIPETGESPITKKHLVLVSLALLIMGFMMGHLTNTQHSGLRMSQESMTTMTTQLVDFKELLDSKEDPAIDYCQEIKDLKDRQFGCDQLKDEIQRAADLYKTCPEQDRPTPPCANLKKAIEGAVLIVIAALVH